MFPVGTIIPYAGDLSKIPYGWHVCDGTNGTPNLSGRFLEGTTTTPKEFKDAGLPNITGEFGNAVEELNNYSTGAFRILRARRGGGDGANDADAPVSFDASRSNPIYGASDTVQPKSYTVYYIMRIK